MSMIGRTPTKDPLVVEAIQESAMVLMHREIVKHGKVVITQAEYEAYSNMMEQQAIAIDTNEAEDVIFSHARSDQGPVS